MQASREARTITIRQANLADVDELMQLLPQLTARADAPQAQMPSRDEARQRISTLIANELVDFLVAVAVDQEQQTPQIVGTLILLVVPNLTHSGRPWAQIENVVVESTMRRQGIGRKLIAAAIAHAQELGCYKVQLISGTKPEQLTFYRGIGFTAESCAGHKLYLA
jgi:GNAT superfamily N-acetyltransferase